MLTGGKRWVWRGTVQGRRRDFGLGSYPTVSLKEARTKALEYLRIGRTGGDPSDARSQVPTFEQAAEKVIQLHQPKWKPGGRSEEQWRASLANYVFPRIGNKPVNKVTTHDVMVCLAPIWYSRSTTARRTRQRISAIMRWSIAHGYRADNPGDDRITAALGKNTKRPQHLTFVHHSRVAGAIAKIRESTALSTMRLAIEFAILTAARSGEARGARWSEMRIADQLWEIPCVFELVLAVPVGMALKYLPCPFGVVA
ncbi:MAG: integrase arm-type DNA-binding domain-containing protein, partial [Actinomycetia bacterium]|nr:integrase arm-type DNA-binding domain-containing protein [Actinomycetes bacterium]